MADEGTNTQSSQEEKSNLINQELELLYFQVQKSNISIDFLKEASKPYIYTETKPKRGRYISFFTKVSVIIGLLACSFYCEPFYRYIRASSRKASIKVLPLWDWRWLHNVQCIVTNPFKSIGQEPDIEICNICSNLTEIDRLDNTGELLLETVTVSYLNEDVPVIIENVTKTWANRGVIDVQKLKQLYLDDEVMRLYMCCEFDSNIPVEHGNHRSLLMTLGKEKGTQYYAHWQNCFKDAAKLFRQVYRRPEFIPSTVELAPASWVFISASYTPSESKSIPLPIYDVFTMLIQLEGHMDVILEPVNVCSNSCHTIKTRLKQGSALILTDVLYTVKYIPSSDEESVTVGIGGSIDD